MEILLYVLDMTLTVMAMYWAVTNATRRPGEPTAGLFRYFEVVAPTPKPEPAKPPKRRMPPKLPAGRRSHTRGHGQ